MSRNKTLQYTHTMELAGDMLSRETFELKVDKIFEFISSYFN